jgi:ribonuclease J
MNLTIHRGTREIGGSCVEIEHEGFRLLIDIGVPLVKHDGSKLDFSKFRNKSVSELLAAKILPDVKGLYIGEKSANQVDAVLLSHAHLDHYGLIGYIRKDITVCCGEGTRRLLYLNSIFLRQKDIPVEPEIFESGKPFTLGSLTITPYLMDHSAFDAYAFVIEGGGKKVIYSGDFREHGRKAMAFYYFLAKAPSYADALLLEGTTLGRADSKPRSEEDIQADIYDFLKKEDNVVFGYPAGQNIDRLVSFFKAAKDADRLFVIDPYIASLFDTLKDVKGVKGLPRLFGRNSIIRVYFPPKVTNLLKKSGHEEMFLKYSSLKIMYGEIAAKRKDILMIIRPSVTGYLERIKGIEGAKVIYSMWGGYKTEKSMDKFNEFLKQRNMEVIDIHTSGHAGIDTLKKTVRSLMPKVLIPIHTFHAGEYEKLFPNVLMTQDGDKISL